LQEDYYSNGTSNISLPEAGGSKMENAPVVSLNGTISYPGASPEVWERFLKWQQEVYSPVQLNVPQRRQVDAYQLVRESPVFPSILRILHYENYAGWAEGRKNPTANSISSEYSNWIKRGIVDVAWSAVYQLVKNYRRQSSNPEEKSDTTIENAPFLHLEAYRFKAEESEKYNKWFIDYCANVFIPLFMNQAGFKGYDYYKFVNISVNYDNLLEREYSTYLSAIYFENSKSFENFEKSHELSVSKKTLRDVFPHGLEYKWYVQYQLQQSWKR
jgi:hypothetical protein